jgi:hypothetical protein
MVEVFAMQRMGILLLALALVVSVALAAPPKEATVTLEVTGMT